MLLCQVAYSSLIFQGGVAQSPCACPDSLYLAHCYSTGLYYSFISQTSILLVQYLCPLAMAGECDNVVGLLQIDEISALTRRSSLESRARHSDVSKAKMPLVETKQVDTFL